MTLKIKKTGDKTCLTYGPGLANWPSVLFPDTKFNKEKGGRYSCNLRIDCSESTPEWLEELDTMLTAARDEEMAQAIAGCKTKKAAKALKFTDHYPVVDEEDDDAKPTGFKIVKSGCNGGFTSKRSGEFIPTRPSIFDAKGHPAAVNIGGGSTCYVGAEINAYNGPSGVGVSLALVAVQCLTLHEQMDRQDPEAFGFDTHEGFDSENVDAKQDTSDGSTGNPDDF